MLKEKLQKASKKALRLVKRTPAASAMMAVVMGAAALSSCSYDNYVDSAGRAYTRKSFNLNSIGGGNGNGWFDVNGGGNGWGWGGAPMYSGNRGGWVPGVKPGESWHRNAQGQGVITPNYRYMLSMDAKDMITKKDSDGVEWQVAKGTKLPKNFKVVVTEEGRTIPVPAAQYEQITAAMKKGELNFVVDANGRYGLVTAKAAEEVKSGNLTLDDLDKMVRNQKTAQKAKQKSGR